MNTVTIDVGEILALRKRAEEKPINIETMRSMANGDINEAPGDSPYYTVNFDNLKIVYTIEQHPMGWLDHISVSQSRKNPETWVFDKIVRLFGFTPENTVKAWEETYQDKKGLKWSAINIVKRSDFIPGEVMA